MELIGDDFWDTAAKKKVRPVCSESLRDAGRRFCFLQPAIRLSVRFALAKAR